MSSLFPRPSLWSSPHEAKYDQYVLKLSWLEETSENYKVTSKQPKKGERTRSKKKNIGESLIYLSIANEAASPASFHSRTIANIIESFNLSHSTAHLKFPFNKDPVFGHKIHCVSVTDTKALLDTIKSIDEEQRVIDHIIMNSPVPFDLHKSIQFLILHDLEVLFPLPTSLSTTTEARELVKNLNFLFKISDSLPVYDNMIVLMTINQPKDLVVDNKSFQQITSLHELKDYYAALLHQDNVFNGQAFTGRISRYIVQDFKEVSSSSMMSQQSICPLPWAKNIPDEKDSSSQSISRKDIESQQPKRFDSSATNWSMVTIALVVTIFCIILAWKYIMNKQESTTTSPPVKPDVSTPTEGRDTAQVSDSQKKTLKRELSHETVPSETDKIAEEPIHSEERKNKQSKLSQNPNILLESSLATMDILGSASPPVPTNTTPAKTPNKKGGTPRRSRVPKSVSTPTSATQVTPTTMNLRNGKKYTPNSDRKTTRSRSTSAASSAVESTVDPSGLGRRWK